ncbi:PREDICTED: uncharacterized protein LOC104825949 [Tarenaya hassleriana]|uniref:uncharacterized protein LOC104825949 n=1 Tax=Tarenaya hassleriana TaxID=28532 RepID=UPI00053C896F|nr:PREDICTED: uncharacterized protein LOC104825949 [Tarenaya hassleriana]
MEIAEYQNDEDQDTAKEKKRSRGMHMIRVVMFMLRRRRRKPFKPGFWRRLVQSVRHLNKDPACVTIIPSSDITMLALPGKKATGEEEEVAAKDGGDVIEQLSETLEGFTVPSSSSSGISGYGSAMSLRDMEYPDYYDEYDNDDDDDDDDGRGGYGVGGGDDMIDVKAEEFIAKFYAQMRMQNQAYTERCKAKRV